MGFLSTVTSALFPGPAAAGQVIEGATNLIDKAFYTKQEQAEDAAKAKIQAVEHYLKWIEATSGQNRARRLIALVVTSLWAMTWVLSFFLALAIPWICLLYTSPSPRD